MVKAVFSTVALSFQIISFFLCFAIDKYAFPVYTVIIAIKLHKSSFPDII